MGSFFRCAKTTNDSDISREGCSHDSVSFQASSHKLPSRTTRIHHENKAGAKSKTIEKTMVCSLNFPYLS